MIRVLQFGMSDNYGGIESFIMNYYRSMDRSRIQFDFVKFDRKLRIAYEEEIRTLGGNVYYMPPVGMKNGYNTLKKQWFNFYDKVSVNAIHFNTVALTNLYAIRFAKDFGLRVYVHAHPSFYDTGFPWWVRSRMRYNKKAVHKFADALLACSKPAGEWMFGSDFSVIPNSIDCSRFKFDCEKRRVVREKYKLNDSFVLLNVGKLSIVKNQMFLLDVLKEIKTQKQNVKLMLVGYDQLGGTLQKRIKEIHLEKDVILTGMVEHPEQFYSAADILVFPSLSEGFGIVPIEAQANGLKAIVADTLVDTINASETIRYLPIVDIANQTAVQMWARAILEDSVRLTADQVRAVTETYDINATSKILEKIYLKYE